MLKIIQRVDWVTKIETIRPLKLNEQSDVIKLLCDIFGYTPAYFIYEQKNKCVISFIAFTKNQKIYAPIHFFYSPLWIDNELDQIKYIEYLTGFMEELKILYKSIDIRLPLGYADIRPFLWNNFKTINNYTYIKSLSDLTYSSSFQRNINKVKQEDYQFLIENISPASESLNMKVFENLANVRKKRMIQIQQLMKGMNDSSLLTCFNCYDKEVLLASAQVFLDKNAKIAYLILLSQANKSKKSNLHSFLHHFMFNSLQNQGYLWIDLMGGDLKSISSFKSSLRADLIPHFTLSYNKNEAFWKLIKEKLINLLKQFIAKFN